LAFKWEDDWLERVEAVIDGWSAETAMIKMVYQGLVVCKVFHPNERSRKPTTAFSPPFSQRPEGTRI
jgi:hypothetical protein